MSLLSARRDGAGPTFVWLHGFTHTRNSARPFRSILAGSREVWTLDLPGHGDAVNVHADLCEIADLVAAELPDAAVDLGGYSFGGRVALHVALRHPSRIRSLSVLGASRGIADADERADRRRRDEVLATRLENIGVAAFLDEWLRQPLFASWTPTEDERRTRSLDAHGLAASLREAGTGTQKWLGPGLAFLTVPTLALAGAHDAKFRDEAAAIAALVPYGVADTIHDAGHAAHLEQPARTAARIEQFLADESVALMAKREVDEGGDTDRELRARRDGEQG